MKHTSYLAIAIALTTNRLKNGMNNVKTMVSMGLTPLLPISCLLSSIIFFGVSKKPRNFSFLLCLKSVKLLKEGGHETFFYYGVGICVHGRPMRPHVFSEHMFDCCHPLVLSFACRQCLNSVSWSCRSTYICKEALSLV